MSKNKLYMLLMIFLVLIILLINPSYVENFGWFDDFVEWIPLPPPLPFGDVTRIFDKIKNIGDDINNFPRTIGNVATNLTDSIINVALLPPKTAANIVKQKITKLQTDTGNLFDAIKTIFEKIKYMTEVLMFTINRARICSEGAERILKNYTLRTNSILSKITIMHAKIKICPENPFRHLRKYYKDCITQIIPFIKSCYKYIQILMKLYKEILTYEELFPQDPKIIDYCKTAHKKIRNKKESIYYANKCNYCLQLQSVLKLGLGELTGLASTVKLFMDKGKEIENTLSKLVIKI